MEGPRSEARDVPRGGSLRYCGVPAHAPDPPEAPMTRDAFLTRRWNVWITAVQGLPTFLFVAYGLATPFGETQAGMVVLSVLGALF